MNSGEKLIYLPFRSSKSGEMDSIKKLSSTLAKSKISDDGSSKLSSNSSYNGFGTNSFSSTSAKLSDSGIASNSFFQIFVMFK